ncbi:MAG: PqqD family peptide modification chaperone [Clostridia bacterium]|nr:PqqD family peptide modification chaperone [Clostridia bacterium]
MGTKKYLSWKQSISLKKYSDSQWVICIYEKSAEPLEYLINDTAAEIISLFDGTKTYAEAIAFLSKKYGESLDSINEKVSVFLSLLKKEYNLLLIEDARKRPIKINIENMYPRVCSLELTNMCNIRCLHCYGDFGIPDKKATLSFGEAKSILGQLRKIGVDIVELTGGDVTVHPQFHEILYNALSAGFKKVVVLTNGILLNSRVFDLANQFRDRIIFQIDLQSLDDEYIHWFTGAKNTVERIKSNIVELVERGVYVRVVTTATKKNLLELDNIAKWAYEVGAKEYAVTTVVSLGRAISDNSDLYISEEKDLAVFSEKLQEIVQKYPNFLHLNIDGQNIRHNCGCVSSHVVIDSHGDIKLCTMDNLQYFNSSLGNVLKEDIATIYDYNRELVFSLAEMSAPNKDSSECKDCLDRFYCNGCILRGVIKGTKNDSCRWLERMPVPVKNKFFKRT